MKIILFAALVLSSSAQAEFSCQSVGFDYQLTEKDFASLAVSPSKLDKAGVEKLAADVAERKSLEGLCRTRLFLSQINPAQCKMTTNKVIAYVARFLTSNELRCAADAVDARLREQIDEINKGLQSR